MKSPVLLIVFNRPDNTRKVFEEIRKAKPSKLFISADGPRSTKVGELEKCNEVRKIFENIDWPCEVKKNYYEENLGCKKAVSSAINWFFDNIEEGIILEDDCLPDQSFFDFADLMLDKYRNNEQIMHINGSNFQNENKRGNFSYFFSRSVHIWGWATWKRAWSKYDLNMKDLDKYINSKKIYKLFDDKKVSNFWISLFKHIKEKSINTWDAQWAYAVLKNEGITISPNANLIKNIGEGADATHTNESSGLNTLKFPDSKSMDISRIQHPDTENLTLCNEADTYTANTQYLTPLYIKVWHKIKSIF